MKRNAVLLAMLCLLTLAGCAQSAQKPTASPEPTQPASFTMAPQTIAPTEPPEPTPAPPPTSVAAPTKGQVLAARDKALEGMTEDQTDRLYTVITGANDWWERQYFFEDIFAFLEDPNDPAWNYFDETGQINVQWSYTGDEYDLEDIARIREEEGLSWTGFCEKYGTEDTLSQLLVNNEYDADGFIGILRDIQSTVQNDDLKNDLQALIDKTAQARDTHDMNAANDIFKTVHDMDYYLLRYGPEDMAEEVEDTSFVQKYFGMLTIYR